MLPEVSILQDDKDLVLHEIKDWSTCRKEKTERAVPPRGRSV